MILSSTALLRRRGTGWLSDRPDHRDLPIGAADLSEDLPVEVVPMHRLPPRYQAGNSCTGSVVLAYQIGEVNAGRRCPRLSGLDNYWKGRHLWGGTGRDGGSYCREAVKALVKYGAVPEHLWPESAWKVQFRPPLSIQREAYQLRGVRGYYRIPTGDVDSMRRVIAARFSVFGGWRVDEGFRDSRGPQRIGVPTGKALALGHAFILDGFRSNGDFDMLNSWPNWRGNEFGPSRALLREDYAASGRDLWAIITH